MKETMPTITCFALAAASAAFIGHSDTSMFYQGLFLLVGVCELIRQFLKR